ncbi:MAG: hypothetical protein AAGD43_15780 [Pseudomonadota bacterium]
MSEDESRDWPLAGWVVIAIALSLATAALIYYADRFSWHLNLTEIPAVPLAVASLMIGIVFASLAWIIPWSIRTRSHERIGLLYFVLAFGLLLRLAMLVSTPALEDDFYRYLWDGGVVASGYNPYARSPNNVFDVKAPEPLQQLAAESGAVIERVNHPQLKTIYPPVAQFWFAVAHQLQPWSLLGWRLLGVIAEVVTVALILLLLQKCGRSPLWSALYWWNPLVIKELINSAHMEFLLLPTLLLAVYLAVQHRYVLGTVTLAFAVGTKLWPLMLVPLMLRPLLQSPGRLLTALLIFGVLSLAWIAWPLLGGIDESSGFVAFAKHWQTNSALFQNTNGLAVTIFSGFGLDKETIGSAVRLVFAAIVGLLAIALSRPRYLDQHDVMQRYAVVIVAMFLLSPAQFPWYGTWVIILLPFFPLYGLLIMTATLPLYYLSFHFSALGNYELFNAWVLWWIWIPIWLGLAVDGWNIWRQPLVWQADA